MEIIKFFPKTIIDFWSQNVKKKKEKKKKSPAKKLERQDKIPLK